MVSYILKFKIMNCDSFVLILVVVDDGLVLYQLIIILIITIVLILVVVDDGLVPVFLLY